MADSDKTIFISYRRNVSSFIARAVFMDLRQHGYDAFMDVESIDNGVFDSVILNQIAARAHFLVILTPGSLERCNEPDDWLRREIEYAIEQQRNIVPLLIDGFSFKDAAPQLTGQLNQLGRFNALEIPHVYFEEAMTRLRNRFLKQPVITATKSISGVEEATVQRKMFIAANQPAPTQDELKSEMYFWRALARNDNSDAEIADYTEAIRLNPGDVDAYNNRAEAYFARGNYVEALSDFQKAAAIQPDDNYVIGGLAVTHHKLGDLEEAKRLWLLLVNQNRKFLSVDWVQAVLNWHDSLAGEAHKLIDNL